jgi:DNA-binding CsgD family transcriptional regulator
VSEDTLLPLIDRIYSSVERPELWPETIYAIGQRIGGRRGFWGMGVSGLYPGVGPDLDAFVRRAGSHGYFLSRADLKALDQHVDEFGELIVRFLKIIYLSALFSQNNLNTGEIIGARLAQHYLPAFEPVAGTSVSAPSRAALRKLIATLWEDGCAFSGDDLRCISLLIPHLDRALRLQTQLSMTKLQTDMISGALDYLTLGVMFVNSSGRPIWLNRRAQELMHRDVRMGPHPANTRSLHKHLEGAVSGRTQNILAISRGGEARPLLLIAMPLKPTAVPAGVTALACGVVFISDPDQIDDPSVDSLRQAFDLTYREAQVAIAIAHGHGLQAAADAIGVAVTTARSQLQQVFAKTATNHQAELVALVHRTLSPLRHD